MKNHYYTFFVGLLFVGCQQQHFDQRLTYSIQRLGDLRKNKISDTLILREALDSAYFLTSQITDYQHDTLFASVSRMYGNALYYTDAYQAQAAYKRGLSVGLRQLTPDNRLISRLYQAIAQLYYFQQDFKTALTYFDSVKINPLAPDAQISKLNLTTLIAQSYAVLNDPITSAQLLSDEEQLAKKIYTPQKLIPFYTDYAEYLKLQKRYSEAIEKAKIGEFYLEEFKKNNKAFTEEDSIAWGGLAFEQGHIFQEARNFSESERYYLKALNIYGQFQDPYYSLYTLRNLGFMYALDQRFDKAEAVLTKGINLCRQPELDDATVRIKFGLLNKRSPIYVKTKQFQKAIDDVDAAIYLFKLQETRPSLTAMLLPERPYLMSILCDKANAIVGLSEKSGNTEGYKTALKLTDSIVQIADDIRADYFSDDAKFNLANDLKPILEKAIELCHNLYVKTHKTQYLEKALGFVEYSRSMVLYENARLNNQLPPQYQAENEALKQQEATLMTKNNVDDLQKYLSQKRQFREKIKEFSRLQMPSVATFKKELLTDNQTAVLEFFVGDSAVTVFTILSNDLIVNTLHNSKEVDSLVLTFRKVFTKPAPDRNATEFNALSMQIYDKILRGGISALPPTVNKLIIAPDGVLAYLPFEILTPSVSTTDFRKTDFLIKRFQISYAYSASLLLEQMCRKSQPTDKIFGGFAPTYNHRDTLKPIATPNKNIAAYQNNQTIASRALLTREGAYELKGAKDEVQLIQTVIGGKTYVNEAANERNFKKEAQQYRILHCAMHSLTDDKESMNSRLLFTLMPNDTTQDSDLTAAELYTMKLNADLAVLSACNTGYGTLSKGEGVMSLARAFTYAGVPATVTSLWKVPDMTTKDVMIEFYKNLKTGMSKDAALRQAKLTYLENAPESIAANPFFWAGFVPMGNMEAMDLSDNTPLSMWAVLGGLLLVLGAGFYFYKKRKSL